MQVTVQQRHRTQHLCSKDTGAGLASQSTAEHEWHLPLTLDKCCTRSKIPCCVHSAVSVSLFLLASCNAKTPRKRNSTQSNKFVDLTCWSGGRRRYVLALKQVKACQQVLMGTVSYTLLPVCDLPSSSWLQSPQGEPTCMISSTLMSTDPRPTKPPLSRCCQRSAVQCTSASVDLPARSPCSVW